MKVAGPIIGGGLRAGVDPFPQYAPADGARLLAEVRYASAAEIDLAFTLARQAQPDWDRAGGPAGPPSCDA